jgi:hypothetical protein
MSDQKMLATRSLRSKNTTLDVFGPERDATALAYTTNKGKIFIWMACTPTHSSCKHSVEIKRETFKMSWEEIVNYLAQIDVAENLYDDHFIPE